MDSSYIILPKLKSICIDGYSLFKKTWSYRFKNGLNIFIGPNGVGKTTTTNLMIYGLIGEYKDEIKTSIKFPK